MRKQQALIHTTYVCTRTPTHKQEYNAPVNTHTSLQVLPQAPRQCEARRTHLRCSALLQTPPTLTTQWSCTTDAITLTASPFSLLGQTWHTVTNVAPWLGCKVITQYPPPTRMPSQFKSSTSIFTGTTQLFTHVHPSIIHTHTHTHRETHRHTDTHTQTHTPHNLKVSLGLLPTPCICGTLFLWEQELVH